MGQNEKQTDISLDIEYTGDKEHFQKLNERLTAYSAGISKLQEKKGQEGEKEY